MGRFRQERTIIRVMPELTLVFNDNGSIYAFPQNAKFPYFWHNWYAPLHSYERNWQPFRYSLLHTKNLSFERCCQLAYRYGVLGKTAVGRLDLRKKSVDVRFGVWSVKGIIDEQEMLSGASRS